MMVYIRGIDKRYLRAVEDLQRTLQPAAGVATQESVRRAVDQLSGNLTSQRVRQLSEELASRRNRDIQRTLEQFSGHLAGHPDLRRVLEKSALAYPPGQFHHLSEQILGQYNPRLLRLSEQILESYRGRFERTAAGTKIVAAAERFEAEAEQAQASDEQEPGGKSLGWWLATRPFPVQAALLFGALQVLDAFSQLLEEVGGEEIPDALQATIRVYFAIIAFLLMWISEQDKSDQ